MRVFIRSNEMDVYEVRPRKDKRGVDLISDALPFGRQWYDGLNAIGYAEHFSRTHDAVIRVCDKAGQFQRVVSAKQNKQLPRQ